MKKDKKIITICASASFYKDVIDVESELKKLGFKVKIPKTANTMKGSGNFKVEKYKVWYTDEKAYKLKTALMNHHFKKVIESDGILVVNKEKKGIKGYIGGNGLMEMVLAYHYKKPIFILNPIDKDHPFGEEIKGLGSIIIDNDLTKITL